MPLSQMGMPGKPLARIFEEECATSPCIQLYCGVRILVDHG